MLSQDTHKYFKFFDGPRYYNRLLDAWETKYADCRGAAIDRLEQLCQEKVHLKVPAAALNLKSKKKSQLVDVSILKAPTGSGSNPGVVASEFPPETDSVAATADAAVKTVVKASKIGVTAKPHNVKSSTMCSRRSLTPLNDARTSASSPDEPMSISGDASEKSRTPSPLSGNEDSGIVIDNRTFCSTLKSTNEIVDNSDANAVEIRNVENGN